MIRVSKNVPGEEEQFDKLWTCIQPLRPQLLHILLLGKE